MLYNDEQNVKVAYSPSSGKGYCFDPFTLSL